MVGIGTEPGVGYPPCVVVGAAGDAGTWNLVRLSRLRILGSRMVPRLAPSACSLACSGVNTATRPDRSIVTEADSLS